MNAEIFPPYQHADEAEDLSDTSSQREEEILDTPICARTPTAAMSRSFITSPISMQPYNT